MAITLPATITGAAQTGFTSNTYTLGASDKNGIEVNGYVTTIGGTQTGVRVHTISDPFRISITLPKVYRFVSSVVNGVLGIQPKNVTTLRVLKGLIPVVGQAPQMGEVIIQIKVPAGADSADQANVRAMQSAAWGLLGNHISAGLGDTTVQGTT